MQHLRRFFFKEDGEGRRIVCNRLLRLSWFAASVY